MFNRKFMIMTIFLVILLAMSAVGASDLNATDDVLSETAVEDNLEISHDETLSATKTVTGNTFDDIQDAVDTANDDDVIELSGTYTGSESEIRIDKKLTFIGKDNAVLDANKKSGIFSVKSEGVSFKNITFINVDYEYGYECAIYINSADISITNCTFINNTAEKGAAIYVGNQCENLQIENCTFINNVAEDGGAVYYDFSQRSPVVGCTFIGNTANNYDYYDGCGGAVYGNAINCTFIDNHAESIGGAVFGHAINCRFIGNGADEDGGAVAGDVVNCTFIGNSALYGGAVAGSALNCIFINNTAGDYGGALVGGHAVNCTFITNHADNNGGAILVHEEVSNSKFISNSANSGGAILMGYGNVENCEFIDNFAYENGGAISMRDGTVENCEFINNTAWDYGGAIYSAGNVNIRKSEFTANEAEKGGAIYAVSSYHEIDEEDSEIIVYDGFYVIDISENSKFTDNHAVNGGAIYIAKLEGYPDRTTVGKFYLNQNVVFENNMAEYGGALYLSGTEFDLKNSAFKSNSARAGGNAIYFDDFIVDKKATSTGEESFNYNACDLTFNDNDYAGAILTNGNVITVKFDSSYSGKGLVKILSKSGTPVKEFESTFSNGKCQFNLNDINGVPAGDYYISISYANNAKVSVKLPVSVESKIATVSLTANAVTKTYGTATKLVVYLKDNKGNAIANEYVKVAIGSTVKNIKTNANGQATLAITNAPGLYTAKITYSTAKTTAKITVKKATPKITASKKTFKVKVKTKQYAITLKVNGKVMKSTKVTLKVNGKTYSAKTNSKGKATFKITKLTKKGTFKSVITYKGSSYYNKVTKTVNIKCK